MSFLGLSKKELLRILFAVFLLFCLSANYAWFNPLPKLVPAYRISDRIPLFWQYNTDSRLFLNAAINFPHEMGGLDQLSGRPLILILVKSFTVCIHPLLATFHFNVDPYILALGEAAMGFYLVYFVFYMLFGIYSYKLFRDYIGLDHTSSFLAVALALTSAWTIDATHTYHTFFAEIITPLLVTAMFIDACRKYSVWKLIAYSLIGGLLLMFKEVYSIYASVYFFLIWKREIKKTCISILLLIMPLMIWSIVITMYGYDMLSCFLFMNKQYLGYNSIFTPFYKSGLSAGAIYAITYLIKGVNIFISTLVIYYSVWLFLAVMQMAAFIRIRKLSKDQVIFIYLFIGFVFLQAYYATYLQSTRMVSDMSFLIYGLGILPAVNMLRRWIKSDAWIIILTLSGWVIMQICMIINLPWIHPYDQIIK